MKDDKTKEELIHELVKMHREIAELKASVTLQGQTRKGYEKNLAWYRILYENNPSMYFVLNPEGTILSVNQFGAEQLGYTIDELIGQSVLTIFHKEDCEAVVQQLRACLKNPTLVFRWEFRKVCKDGSIMWVEEAVRTIRGDDGNTIVLVVCENISERKAAEEALQASEARFSSFMNNLPGVAFMKDVEGHYIFVNQKWEQIFKKRSDDWLGKTDDEIWPALIAGRFKENDRAVMRNKKAFQTVEAVPHKDGLHYWSVSKFPLFDKEGNPYILGGIAIDITDRKRVEKQFRNRLLLEEALAEASRLLVSDFNPDLNQVLKVIGRAVGVSHAYIFLFRKKRTNAEIAYEWCSEKTKPGIGNLKCIDMSFFPWLMKQLEAGESILISDVDVLPKEAKAERTILEYYSVSSFLAVPINFSGNNLLGFMWFDDTKVIPTRSQEDLRLVRILSEMLSIHLVRKQLEERLVDANKLESVGVIARGIARDFDSLLAIILGNISFAEKHIKEKILPCLEETERTSLWARDLTLQLRNFTKNVPAINKVASTKELLRELTNLIAIGADIQFELSLPDDLWSVEVDEVQISQILISLLFKAGGVMPGGGVIRIGAENITVGAEDRVRFKNGKYLKITIADERMEMAKEHLSKIFNSSFSTKEEGSGLAIAYSMIENCKGYIDMELNPEVGTKFYIHLPATEEIMPWREVGTHQGNVKESLRGAKYKILAIHKDILSRKVVREILSHIGYYDIVFANDSIDAIQLYRRSKKRNQPFDAVIMDVASREVKWEEAIIGLREIDPCVKVVASTCSTSDTIVYGFRKYGFRAVVIRPYKIEELSEILHNIIFNPSIYTDSP